MAKVRVYKTRSCSYCVAAMRFLDEKGVPYEAIDCSTDAEARRWLVEVTGQTTVPQIFVGDTSIGGYTDMRALAASGKLDALLAA